LTIYCAYGMLVVENRKEGNNMITVRGDTTLVGVSELRTKFDRILKKAKDHEVIIEKRNKCVAVLVDIQRYTMMEEILDALEDVALGYIAQQRDKKTKKADYVDISKAKKAIMDKKQRTKK